jgi:hypothetical protein
MNRSAGLLIRAATRLLPVSRRGWGRAMEAELAAIEGTGPALGFALGCAAAMLREAARFHILRLAGANEEGDGAMHFLTGRPRRLAGLCAVAATGLGMLYMALAGAPPRYLAVNGVALVSGLLAAALLARVGDVRRGIVDLMLASALLLTAWLGISADGVTRWLSVGGVLLQPGLFLLPVLVLRYARSPDALSTVAVSLAAFALALQPDRALAGALAAGLMALAVARPERNVFLALSAAATGFAATLVRADPSGAMPWVDQILASSFAVHPLAGLAVWTGAALMLVPALAGLWRPGEARVPCAVFGALWFAVILAALLGNYPTPMVGYGASAIFGYLLCLLGLPARAQGAAADPGRGVRPDMSGDGPHRFRVRAV